MRSPYGRTSRIIMPTIDGWIERRVIKRVTIWSMYSIAYGRLMNCFDLGSAVPMLRVKWDCHEALTNHIFAVVHCQRMCWAKRINAENLQRNRLNWHADISSLPGMSMFTVRDFPGRIGAMNF